MLTEQKTSSVCLEYHQRSIYSRHATLNRSKSSKRMHPKNARHRVGCTRAKTRPNSEVMLKIVSLLKPYSRHQHIYLKETDLIPTFCTANQSTELLRKEAGLRQKSRQKYGAVVCYRNHERRVDPSLCPTTFEALYKSAAFLSGNIAGARRKTGSNRAQFTRPNAWVRNANN